MAKYVLLIWFLFFFFFTYLSFLLCLHLFLSCFRCWSCCQFICLIVFVFWFFFVCVSVLLSCCNCLVVSWFPGSRGQHSFWKYIFEIHHVSGWVSQTHLDKVKSVWQQRYSVANEQWVPTNIFFKWKLIWVHVFTKFQTQCQHATVFRLSTNPCNLCFSQIPNNYSKRTSW